MKGTLYLIPAPLSECSPSDILPQPVITLVGTLSHFIVENEKSARAWLKKFPLQKTLQELVLTRFDEHSTLASLDELLTPLTTGISIGLLSEAGVPCIADPGAPLVRAAHRLGITVKPLIGPSSVLLGLMGSGLYGQSFQFLGYPPKQKDECREFLRTLQINSRTHKQSMVLIETPYRSRAFYDLILESCAADTLLCVGENLTAPQETVLTHSIQEWKKLPAPLFTSPAIFVLQSGNFSERKK